MDNRLYLVTFEQVDPLFVIDTTNPKNMKIMGELVMP
ncbi:beta-propeller domain-containing protein [Candidatus Peribacteria bacterium]|nr:beta-propeller domain-containing protein [Candidatus Peribacteria bacterium]